MSILIQYAVGGSTLFVHPNGTSVVAGSTVTRSNRLIDMTATTHRVVNRGAGGYAVAISADGRLVLSSSGGFEDGRLHVFQPASSPGRSLDGHRGSIQDIAVHPDGRHVVTTSLDTTLRVWDLDTDRCIRILSGHGDQGRSVAVSPDGRRIVSGSDDETVRVWDFDTGDALATLTAHDTRVVSVGFSPDGRRIVSGDEGGTIRVWETDPGTARRMWHAAARRQPVTSLVKTLFAEGLGIDAVVARLQSTPDLADPDRARAVRLARARAAAEGVRAQPLTRPKPAQADTLRVGAWRIATSPNHDHAAYERAHQSLELAITQAPDDRRNWNTLGVVLYRLERYEEALTAFARAQEINDMSANPFHVAHYRVWEAPCHFRLGDAARARMCLAEVRAAPAAVRGSLAPFITEAAAIIEGSDKTRR